MKKLLYFICSFSVSAFAQEFTLSNAALCDGNASTKSQSELAAGKEISSAYKANKVIGGSCIGWTNLGGGDLWYDASKLMTVHSINVATKQYLGGWPLYTNPCGTNKDCTPPWWNGRWSADEELEAEISGDYPSGGLGWKEVYDTDITNMGCMQQHPLRYGDVEGDGNKELVLFLAHGYSVDFLIFSPVLHKTIFASKLDYNNVVKHETLLSDPLTAESVPQNIEKQYQFWARTGADENRVGAMRKGLRSFGKLYVGHFASETSNDILVWRKLYESNLVKNPVKGFTKQRDTFIHYKLIDGEYKKQLTDSATIKGWLTAKQLTWQKGYPSKSECPGQGGQLIPEMHDPLLNDPEVLQ